MGVINVANGKVWIRVKVKLPDNLPHTTGEGEFHIFHIVSTDEVELNRRSSFPY